MKEDGETRMLAIEVVKKRLNSEYRLKYRKLSFVDKVGLLVYKTKINNARVFDVHNIKITSKYQE